MLFSLPRDILHQEIIPFLSFSSLFSLSHTCTYFRNLLDSSSKLPRVVAFQNQHKIFASFLAKKNAFLFETKKSHKSAMMDILFQDFQVFVFIVNHQYLRQKRYIEEEYLFSLTTWPYDPRAEIRFDHLFFAHAMEAVHPNVLPLCMHLFALSHSFKGLEHAVYVYVSGCRMPEGEKKRINDLVFQCEKNLVHHLESQKRPRKRRRIHYPVIF